MIQVNLNQPQNNKCLIQIWLIVVVVLGLIFVSYREIMRLDRNQNIQFNMQINRNEKMDLQLIQKQQRKLKRIKIDNITKSIRDETDQQLIFHGVNVVYKSKPYIPKSNEFHPQESFTEQDMNDLQQLGFNFIRLGISWESVETSINEFNQTYLNEMEGLINRLGEYGIYTMIDIHQDVGAKFICGHGFPNFYSKQVGMNAKCRNGFISNLIKQMGTQFGVCRSIKDYKYQTDDHGNPLPSECSKLPFAKYYGTSESLAIFDALYTNKQQFRDKFIRFWEVIVQRFAINSNVMGFDPLNEPFVSNFIDDVSLLYPNNFDRNRLLPLYTEMYQIMQKYNKNAILHFEVAPVPNVIATMGGIVNNAGYDRLPGQENQTDFQINHVMHDHFYCCQTGFNMCNSKGSEGQPKDDDESEYICDDFHRRRIDKRTQDAHRLQIPFMITEFGACYNNQVCLREINQVLDQCDRKLCSGWAYWQFKNFNDTTTVGINGAQGFYDLDGILQVPKVKALSRPYQRKTQGTLLKSSFDIYYRILETSFTLDLSLTNATTEIFINRYLWYPNRNDGFNNNRGFIMSIRDSSLDSGYLFPSIQYLNENNIIRLNFSQISEYHNKVINIQIQPYHDISDIQSQSEQLLDDLVDMDFQYN